MSYIKKQPGNVSSRPLQEGDGGYAIYTYTQNNYTEIVNLINSGNSSYLDDLNIHPAAGVQESKLTGAVDEHPHYAGSNLGDRVIGDSQLSWDSQVGLNTGGVYLMRTFRPGMKVLWGLTPPIVARETSELAYDTDLNVTLRVPFASLDGGTGPFAPGAQVTVMVTPHIPPGTHDDAEGYFDGTEFLVIGTDHQGFDLWVCTENIEGNLYFFSYVAMGWEIV